MPLTREHRTEFGRYTTMQAVHHMESHRQDFGPGDISTRMIHQLSPNGRMLAHNALHHVMDMDPEDDVPPIPGNIPDRAGARPQLDPPTPDNVLPQLASAVAALSIAYAETGDVRIRRVRGSIEDVIRARRNE